MNARPTFVATLLGSAIPALLSNNALGQVHPEKPTYKYEKCYGVARAARNDCFFSGNSCAGTVMVDRDPHAWIYVPQGTCRKIVGGTLDPPQAR